MPHTGHEFVLCLAGQLEYQIEGRAYALRAGDSLPFAARLRHTGHYPGAEQAKALLLPAGFKEYDSREGPQLSRATWHGPAGDPPRSTPSMARRRLDRRRPV